jgi:hypothetical protein
MYAFVVTKVPVQERNTKSYKFPEENSTEPNQHASSRSHHGGNARQLLQYLLRQSPRVTSRASPDQIDQYTPQVLGSVPINRVHAGLGQIEGRRSDQAKYDKSRQSFQQGKKEKTAEMKLHTTCLYACAWIRLSCAWIQRQGC